MNNGTRIEVSESTFKMGQEIEEKISEIADRVGKTPREVYLFYISHNYTLKFLDEATAITGNLNIDNDEVIRAIKKVRAIFDKLDVELTWKDRITAIPYLLAYWISRPVLWLVHEVYNGVVDAKDNVWDD